jgi:hypothetical protein
MDIVDSATSYDDYVRKLMSHYKPTTLGIFFAVHAIDSVNATRPQVFLNFGPATVAYGPKTFSEVYYTIDDETVQFLLVEKPTGGMSINAFTFGAGAKLIPAPQFEFTPSQVKAMHSSELISTTNRFAAKACVMCHFHTRRRMIEPDNHGRRFQYEPSWVFRDPSTRLKIQANLDELFRQFVQGGAQSNPVYQWVWEQPHVIARGGELHPEDTFTYEPMVQNLLASNAREMLSDLQRNPRWSIYKDAFKAAVTADPAFDGLLIGLGVDPSTIAADRDRIERYQAAINLQHIQSRDRETMAWILSFGDHAIYPSYQNNDLLLLNRHSLETIGPAILDMIVTDSEWSTLTPDAQNTKVRLSDLAVQNLTELKNIVLSPTILSKTRRRANTQLVLELILQNRNKVLTYLSSSLSINAETGGSGVELIDIYAEALTHPRDCKALVQPNEPVSSNWHSAK